MSLAGQFLLLVLGIAAAAAAAMVPRADEWLAVMNDDRRQAEIIARLEPRLDRDGSDPTLLVTLARAYADLGDTAHAIPAFERYLALQPGDADGQRRLAGLYGAVGDLARQRTALERALTLSPRLAVAAELAALYRTLGLAEDERTLLGRFAPELTVGNGLLLRLAQLQREAGDTLPALATLSRPEVVQTVPKAPPNGEERLLLATLLAEAGQGAEALRLGRIWIQQWHEPWLATRLLLAVAPRAVPHDAAALAEAVAGLHPEVRLYLAGQLAEQGAPALAMHLLRGWQGANPRPAAAELAAFLAGCARWGEPAIAWDAFATMLRSGADPEIAARYADALAAQFGLNALAPFWSAMPPGTLGRRPLLAARLAFAAGDPARAYDLAATLDIGTLGASEQELWADLLDVVAPPGAMLATLQSHRRKGTLPRGLLLRYARLAGSAGHDGEFRAAAAALARD